MDSESFDNKNEEKRGNGKKKYGKSGFSQEFQEDPDLSEVIKDDGFQEGGSKGKEDKPQISLEGKILYRVKIVHSSATEYCISETSETFEREDFIILPTRYGKDLGQVLGVVTNHSEVKDKDVLIITRRASRKDLKRYEENKEKDRKAFQICKEKAMEHKLDMKLVSAHYLLDESKILFFFTADARVDFRELVKDLVAIFRTRIELRQIGVRDESRVLGGVGMCGRGFCCNTITDQLNPVSIKMAKEQNLSLNSLKISGACGRLLCCLAYEYPFYKETKSKLPNQGARIQVGSREFCVDEVNIFKKKVVLACQGERQEYPFDSFVFDEGMRKWTLKSKQNERP